MVVVNSFTYVFQYCLLNLQSSPCIHLNNYSSNSGCCLSTNFYCCYTLLQM